MDESRWQQLSSLLDELFDLDQLERAARLADIAREDAALATELERLLAIEARTGLLDASVAEAAGTVMMQLAAAESGTAGIATVSGKRIGHYRLIERLGTGGMGEVWRAERMDDFEQSVAVKLIRPLLDSPALRERFARERRILARLDHPGIARLLDGGVADDGMPWYAMEFVPGIDIIRFANERKLGTRERVGLVLQVCDAVAHAQAQLIVHRDIKPSNILVDAQGRARVLDFGIARLMDDSGIEALTATGVRMFSPAYAAPEQIRGDAVGTAADVFALGSVLYELLVGQPPYPARSASHERILAGLTNETAPVPSRVLREKTRNQSPSTTTISPREIAGDLDTLVATALQPDSARRYAGAAQLADDLRRWLDGRPIAAQPDTATYRMRKFVARHRFAVGSASAVLLALIGGLGLALWQANVAHQQALRADAEAQRAEQQAERARAQVERTRKVKEFMMSVFLPVDPLRRGVDAPKTIEQAFDAALQRARTELNGDPVLQADVLDDFGEILTNQGRFDEAQPLLEQALSVAEKEYGPDHPVAAESLINLAVVASATGRAQAAAQAIDRAIAILERDEGGDPLALPMALMALTTVTQALGDHAGMQEASHRTLTLLRERAPDHPGMIPALSNEAMVVMNAGRLDEADALLKEAIAMIEREHGQDSPTLWSALTSLAALEFERGNPQEERAHTERALALVRSNFPGDHPWTASSLADLGLQRTRMDEFDEGQALLRESIDMYERLGDSGAIPSLRYLAIAQRKQGNREGALASLKRAQELCVQSGEEASLVCIVVRANRAMMLAGAGQGELALREAEAAAALLPVHPGLFSELGQVKEARAAALAALGQREAALAEQDAVIALLRDNFGAEHPETRRVERGRVLLEQQIQSK